MDIKEFLAVERSRRSRIIDDNVRAALKSALDGAALMKSRIINKRENAEGGIFGIYSPDYLKRRINRNLLGDEVNFSFNNDMWLSTTARVIENTDLKVVILISPDAANAFKMVYNTQRFGTIMALNQEEQDLISEIYANNII